MHEQGSKTKRVATRAGQRAEKEMDVDGKRKMRAKKKEREKPTTTTTTTTTCCRFYNVIG
jgi:hypothetical protein